MINSKLFIQIAQDLKVPVCPGEGDASHKARLVYSALSQWLRTFAAPASEDGILSKGSLHNRSAKVLSSFIALDSSIQPWFYPSNASNPINGIRDVLALSGDLVDYGFQNRMVIAQPSLLRITPTVAARRGIVNLPGGCRMSGLAMLDFNGCDENALEIGAAFGIPQKPATVLLKEKARQEWKPLPNLQDYELFNANRKSVFSSCWEKPKVLQPGTIYMARREVTFGTYEYRLVQQKGNAPYYIGFSDYESDTHVRLSQRLLYAIKHQYGTPAYVSCETIGQYQVWHFWSNLPPAEDALLRYIGWPLADIENKKSEFVLNRRLEPFMGNLISNLAIERKNG